MNQALSRPFVEWPQLKIRPTLAYRGEPPWVHRHMTVTNGFYSFWLIEKGQVDLSGKFGKITLRQGEWVLFPLFLSKRQDFTEGTVLLSLGFEAAWSGEIPWMEFDRPLTGRAASRNSLITSAGQVLKTFSAAARRLPLPERSMGEADVARLQSRFFAFLEKLTPYVIAHGGGHLLSGTRHPRIHPLLTELRRRPSIRPLPYARWRQEAGLSRVHIDRLFRAESGYSPKQQRNRFLLAALKRELITGRASIKELSSLFGFSDSSHLCRWFRGQAGVSPEQFRLHGIE